MEQINTEIFLKSAPLPLRILIKKFFLQDVLDRYYDLRLTIIDLIELLATSTRTRSQKFSVFIRFSFYKQTN